MKNDTDSGAPELVYARPRKVIRLHWFNVACWIVLTFSGLGIIRGELRFMPDGYAEWLQNLVGGQFTLLVGHSLLGLIWVVTFILFTAFNWREIVYPFLKEVLSVTPRSVVRDLTFMVVSIANLFGLLTHIKLPPGGRYNGAQRLLGTFIIASSAIIAVTGITMFSLFVLTPLVVDGIVFRWALVAHALFVGLVYIGLIAHLYYSLIEEPEVLRSMRDGYLDKEYVQRHCPGWYDELKQQGKV